MSSATSCAPACAPAPARAPFPGPAPASALSISSLLQVRISKRKLVREGFHKLFSISRYHRPVILAAPAPRAAPEPGATPTPETVPVYWQVQPGEEA